MSAREANEHGVNRFDPCLEATAPVALLIAGARSGDTDATAAAAEAAATEAATTAATTGGVGNATATVIAAAPSPTTATRVCPERRRECQREGEQTQNHDLPHSGSSYDVPPRHLPGHALSMRRGGRRHTREITWLDHLVLCRERTRTT